MYRLEIERDGQCIISFDFFSLQMSFLMDWLRVWYHYYNNTATFLD
jgi:hypothetical protein